MFSGGRERVYAVNLKFVFSVLSLNILKVRRKLAEKMRQLPDEGWFLQALVKDELSSLLSSVRGQNVCTTIELILQTII